jgi:hypothetical protein
MCYGQLEANLAHGRPILWLISVAKFEMHGKALAKNQLFLKAVGPKPMLPYQFIFSSHNLFFEGRFRVASHR